MISAAFRERVRPAVTLCWTLWASLTASILVYVLVAGWLARQPGEPPPGPAGIETLFGGLAAVGAVASLLVPRILLSDGTLRRGLAAGPAAAARLPRGLYVSRTEGLLPEEIPLLAMPGLYFTPFLLRLVLDEAVALLGLVLAMLSRSLEPMLPFVAAALALNWLARPRLGEILERAARLAPGA